MDGRTEGKISWRRRMSLERIAELLSTSSMS